MAATLRSTEREKEYSARLLNGFVFSVMSKVAPPPCDMKAKQAEAAPIVAKLSLKEKIKLCSGRDMWYLETVHWGTNHYLPPVMITDGPHGLRKQKEGDATDLLKGRIPATCFPTASCLACSWDEDLLYQVGTALAHECIKEDVAVLLGPGMNIKRHSCGGRNFEYLSEDPLLTGRLASSIVKGVQSQGVGTSIKHFSVNNQERKRMRVNVVVDEGVFEKSIGEDLSTVSSQSIPSQRPLCALTTG